jgi:hypothetical protein
MHNKAKEGQKKKMSLLVLMYSKGLPTRRKHSLRPANSDEG